MKRLKEFFVLADHQMERNRGAVSPDEVLCLLVPPAVPPFGRSWCESASWQVPEGVRLEFVAAFHWLGGDPATGALILPLFCREDMSRHQQLDDRAYLVLIGAVTAPKHAPCRSRSWTQVRQALPGSAWNARAFHRRMASLLNERAASQVMKDHWNSAWGHEAWLSPKAIEGLGWVLHDGTEPTTEEEAYRVLDSIMGLLPEHQAWTPSDVVFWAEICADYVAAYRIRKL